MTYYAVIDTNVLVSAMLKGTSIPGIIIDQAINGAIIPLVNMEIINEYRDVLSRNKFHFNSADVSTMIDELSKRAVFEYLYARFFVYLCLSIKILFIFVYLVYFKKEAEKGRKLALCCHHLP